MAIGFAVLVLAANAASAVEIEGDRTLPPCNWRKPLTHDCHITDRSMAINMMTNPPSRERQPNAYWEFRQYERERERETMGNDDRR